MTLPATNERVRTVEKQAIHIVSGRLHGSGNGVQMTRPLLLYRASSMAPYLQKFVQSSQPIQISETGYMFREPLSMYRSLLAGYLPVMSKFPLICIRMLVNPSCNIRLFGHWQNDSLRTSSI